MKKLFFVLGSAALALAGCGGGGGDDTSSNGDKVEIDRNPFPSTYAPYPSTVTLLKDATVLDGIGGQIDRDAAKECRVVRDL